MIRRLVLLVAVLLAGGGRLSYAQDAFSAHNPDINKYEFARSYISALKYMKDIDDRWAKNEPKKLFADQKDKMIVASFNDLALDSSDLRIVKNYLKKYLISHNLLMRKIADIVVVATSRGIAINDEEKLLWQKWYALNAAGQATRAKEIDFVKTQYSFEVRRKDQDKQIVQASVLLTKLLMSDKNKDGKGHLLAITAQQRQKLLDKLDTFGSDELDWGIKKGQSTLEASIAVIRQILEDSIWISLDEK